jgi:hypothetical protein
MTGIVVAVRTPLVQLDAVAAVLALPRIERLHARVILAGEVEAHGDGNELRVVDRADAGFVADEERHLQARVRQGEANRHESRLRRLSDANGANHASI